MLWLIYSVLSAITWGLATIFVRLAMERVDNALVTTIRTLLMGIMLICIMLFAKNINKETITSIQTRDWIFIALASFASCIAWLFYFSAFQYGYISKVVSIDRLSFVLIIFLSAIIFGEPITTNIILGAAFMIFGVFLISYK